MALFKNWRFNPFTQITNDVSIIDEDATVAFLDEINIFGIRLNESPKLNGIPSVAIVTDDTAATAFTEVPRTQAPSSGEFRVDYDADTFFATGIVEFNSADDGQAVLVTYRGTGSVVKDKFLTSQLTTLTSNVGIEGDLELAQDLFFTGTGNAKINEFSTDGTLAGNSDTALPTEQAVKTFVEALDAANVKLTGAQTIAGLKAFSTGINVTGSGTVQHNGTPAIGYLDNGTPLFAKVLTGTFINVNTAIFTIAHGISSAFTGDKILSITAHIKESSVPRWNQVSLSDNEVPLFTHYDDTSLSVQRGATGTTPDVFFFIIFKL